MPAKYAVLVGINRYPHYNDKMQLKGCVNDARRMQMVLVDHFGFDAANIRELHDEAATREAILGGLEWLTEVAEEDDIVVFHYSGHGRRRKAKLRKNSTLRPTDGEWFDKAEGTGFDSTLMPSNTGPAPIPHLDITDNTINNWLERITAKTRNVTLIFDACHSGTVTRGSDDEVQVRTVPADDRTPEELDAALPEPELFDADVHAKKGKSGWLPLSDRYTVISGCRDSETSKESDVSGNSPFKRHGALSYHLTNALLESVPGTTHRDVFEIAGQNVTSWFKTQHPQMEGALDREIFGHRDIRPIRFLPISSVDGDSVVLGGGLIHELRPGSTWDVYPHGTKLTDGSSSLGRIEVTDVGPFTSAATVLEQDGEIAANCRCVEQNESANTDPAKIQNPESKLKLEFNIFRVQPDGKLEPANENGFEFNERERLAFEVINKESHAVFISILNIGTDGSVSRLYPRRTASELIASGGRIIKGADRAKLRVNLDGFDSDRGTQSYIAFGATQAIDLAWLCRDKEDETAARKAKQLSARRRKKATRSLKQPGEQLSERDDWLTITRSIVVARRAG